MPIQSIKSGTLSRSTAVGNAIILPGDFESIATFSVTSNTSTITFSSIPQTFTHLQIRASLKQTTGAAVALTINSGSFARRHYLYGNGSVVVTGSDTTNDLLSVSDTANIFAASIIDILDYTSTNKNRTYRILGGADFNGSGTVIMFSGLDTSTTAINSITLSCSNSFNQYSHFALYGIRG